jgi:hypothetical protein
MRTPDRPQPLPEPSRMGGATFGMFAEQAFLVSLAILGALLMLAVTGKLG